jgi:hypothetical protein
MNRAVSKGNIQAELLTSNSSFDRRVQSPQGSLTTCRPSGATAADALSAFQSERIFIMRLSGRAFIVLRSGKIGTSTCVEHYLRLFHESEETHMLKTIVIVATVALAGTAYAQTSPGTGSSSTQGQQMQQSTGSGAAKSAQAQMKKKKVAKKSKAPASTVGSTGEKAKAK